MRRSGQGGLECFGRERIVQSQLRLSRELERGRRYSERRGGCGALAAAARGVARRTGASVAGGETASSSHDRELQPVPLPLRQYERYCGLEHSRCYRASGRTLKLSLADQNSVATMSCTRVFVYRE